MLSAQGNSEIQPKRNAPYSGFGLGDPLDQFFVASAGMGGLSATFQDAFHLNLRNPASLAYLQATAFEVGFNAKYSILNGGDEKARSWGGNLAYLALGFPLKNPINEALDRQRSKLGWGMAFSLQPYTVVGYDIIADSPGNGGGPTESLYKGAGGSYRVIWGNAVRWKDISLGANISYLFGKLSTSQRAAFTELPASYTSRFLDETSLSGLILEFGAQYTLNFKELDDKGEKVISGKRLVFGAFGKTQNSFKTNSSSFIWRNNATYEVSRDTILFEEEVSGTGTLPMEFTAGVSFEDVNKFRFGIEYSIGQWSKYRNDAQESLRVDLIDTWGVTAGLEYVPDITSFNRYLKRVRYRLGGFYRKDPRSFDVGQLDQYAVTLGFGFPIVRPRQQTSFINFSVEAGKYGHPELIHETYVKMALGFTLNDNTWFYKRKFN